MSEQEPQEEDEAEDGLFAGATEATSTSTSTAKAAGTSLFLDENQGSGTSGGSSGGAGALGAGASLFDDDEIGGLQNDEGGLFGAGPAEAQAEAPAFDDADLDDVDL